MANRYFAGNSLAAFFRTTTGIVEVTTAGTFNSAYVSSSISLPNPTDQLYTTTFSATGTIYTRFDYRIPTSSSGSGILYLYNGSTPYYRVSPVSGLLRLQYWNGSSWTTIGSGWTWSPSTLYTFMLKVVLGTSMTLYVNGTQVDTGSGASGATTITQASLSSISGNASNASQVMIADYDLRDSHYMATAINGNSAANTGQASGVYTDVNETVLDESTNISITTSANKAGLTYAAITVPAGYVIAAAVINARGRATGTITDGKLGIRSGGTNYSSSARGYNGGYEPRSYIVDNDPATATGFTQSGFNAAEIYLEAA